MAGSETLRTLRLSPDCFVNPSTMRRGPRTFASKAFHVSSAPSSSSGLSREKLAAFKTRTSTEMPCPLSSDHSSLTAAGSVWSHCFAMIVVGSLPFVPLSWPRSSVAAASRTSSRRPMMTTAWAPALMKHFAIPRPIPVAPPVTIMVLPAWFNSGLEIEIVG